MLVMLLPMAIVFYDATIGSTDRVVKSSHYGVVTLRASTPFAIDPQILTSGRVH